MEIPKKTQIRSLSNNFYEHKKVINTLFNLKSWIMITNDPMEKAAKVTSLNLQNGTQIII